ncbi:MAG: alpha/beta hydrolase, partial [Gammaproteobacteria bacterium]|nr:alpha/beta hydrolase [Gammaproteobacteria bacterium]
YLPPDYHTTKKSYPVIYMTDGQNLFDAKTSNAGEWQMDELMQSYTTDNNPANDHLVSIIVGIDHAGANRRAEYLPFDFIPTKEQLNQTGSSFQKPLKGKGAEFADWLVNDLKPYIDTTYRTKPEREHTTMMGSSMGGLISCYTALRHQKTISKAACYSSAFLKRLVANNMVEYAKQKGKQKPIKIHMDMGDNEFGLFGDDILLETKEVYDALLSAGFSQNEIRNQVIKGGTHDEPSWRSRTAEIIEWLNE